MNENIRTLNAQQVEDYLKENPGFFNEHLELLEQLTIPHPSGSAVSLISKQLEIFRTRHKEIENQLNTLIDIARENDSLFNQMHELTLAMLNAGTMEEVLGNLDQVLADCFLTDFVAVRIIRETIDSPIANLFVAPTDKNLIHFQQILAGSEPKCSRPTLAQAIFLFGDAAVEVKSCAFIPLLFTQMEGLLVIGSRQENRFHYSMGNLFLTQMSEIVGARLVSLLPEESN